MGVKTLVRETVLRISVLVVGTVLDRLLRFLPNFVSLLLIFDLQILDVVAMVLVLVYLRLIYLWNLWVF